MNQQSSRHHYIPVFYLKRWTQSDGKLCEFSRPHKSVVGQRKYPTATGFERHLYTVPGLPPEKQSVLEDEFFRDTDDLAAKALEIILAGNGKAMNDRMRNGWSLFINGLHQRHPDRVAELKNKSALLLEEKLELIRTEAGKGEIPPLPEGMSFEQFAEKSRNDMQEKDWAKLLQSIIDNSIIGLFLSNMRWNIVTFHNLDYGLLTSDRPVIMTNGIDHPEGQIVLPISPTQAFFAVNTAEMEHSLVLAGAKQSRKLAQRINEKIVRQARRFVYSVDDRQANFIQRRFEQPSA